jgi:two-component SAPR family response regulator
MLNAMILDDELTYRKLTSLTTEIFFKNIQVIGKQTRPGTDLESLTGTKVDISSLNIHLSDALETEIQSS